jgi:phosphoribosylaminoimidazole-succinocarboxamide synthase
MTRIKEAIAKLEAMKKECVDTRDIYVRDTKPEWVIAKIDSILADLNVHDLDWKPS